MSVRGLIPLRVAEGQVLHVESMDEGLAQLVCRGRDAFLTLKLTPGAVTYLPGSNPVMTPAPIPEDPCGADAEPTMTPGGTPEEPAAPPAPLDAPVGSLGPESPPTTAGGGAQSALRGTWLVQWAYTLTHDEDLGQDIYVGSTTVTRMPPGIEHDPLEDLAAAGFTEQDLYRPAFRRYVGVWSGAWPLAGTNAFPSHVEESWIYRGPDRVGPDLIPIPHPEGTSFHREPSLLIIGGQAIGGTTMEVPPIERSINVKLAHYRATHVQTPDDLVALRPQNPDESEDPLPARVETLVDMTVPWPNLGTSGVVYAMPLNQATGPQLLRLECITDISPDDLSRAIFASVESGLVHGPLDVEVVADALHGQAVGASLGAA